MFAALDLRGQINLSQLGQTMGILPGGTEACTGLAGCPAEGSWSDQGTGWEALGGGTSLQPQGQEQALALNADTPGQRYIHPGGSLH